MSDPDIYPLADTQNEELIRFLKNQITSLRSKLPKKEEKLTTPENMLNTTVDCLNAKRHAYRGP